MGEPVNPRSLQILDDGTLFALYDAGEDVYFRIFNAAGQVFDPTARRFVAIGSANDSIAATPLTAIGGTGFSGYRAAVSLADLHSAGDVKPLVLLAFDNAAPADGDVTILPPIPFSVQFGQLGRAPLTVQCEVSVKSTEGTAAQLKVWLDRDAQRIAVGTAGGTIFTANAGTDVITSAGHGLNNGDVLLLTSSTTLPAGLPTGTPFYVRDKTTDTFKLAASEGGAAIDITDAGTGTHKWHKPTASLKLREHGSAAGVYLFEQDFSAANLIDSCFEAEIADPNFTPDRQYDAEAIVVENGNTHESYHPHVVM